MHSSNDLLEAVHHGFHVGGAGLPGSLGRHAQAFFSLKCLDFRACYYLEALEALGDPDVDFTSRVFLYYEGLAIPGFGNAEEGEALGSINEDGKTISLFHYIVVIL